MNDKSSIVSADTTPSKDVMERSIFKYILNHTFKEQCILVLLTLLIMPFVYLSLEIPKIIINDAISGGASSFQFFDLNLTQIQYLLVLSFIFLILVVLNGALKYFISVYRGILGERMLRRFRYTLYSRILRFPLPHIKKSSSGEFISMITAESESLGGFIGDSIALPVFQGGLLITYIYFIFVQNFWLGLAAIALYPPQAFLIPHLQKHVNRLSRDRVQEVRKLADRVEETVNAATDIKVNDTSRLERADMSDRLGTIFNIRLKIYQRKFFIKFLNNFLGHLTPFFFYSIGGYLVIRGELTLGALVAVLAAYKDIGPPWKELLKYYQIMEDVKVKYGQIIRHFEPEGIVSETTHTLVPEQAIQFEKSIDGQDISLTAEHHSSRLENLFFKIALDKHTGMYSKEYESTREFLFLLTGLDPPERGILEVDGIDLCALPEYVRGRNIGYCTSNSFIMNLSVQDNLHYGVKNQPAEGLQSLSLPAQQLKEARLSGNSLHNVNSEWLDIHGAGFTDMEEFRQFSEDVLDAVELSNDIMSLALESYLNIEIHKSLASDVVNARKQVKIAIDKVAVGGVIEPFDSDQYNRNLTVAENLLFGTPTSKNVTPFVLANLPEVTEILNETKLKREFFSIGLDLAKLMLELFSNVDQQRELIARYSFIEVSRFGEYRAIVDRIEQQGIDVCNESEQAMLISLTLQLCPAQHNIDLISPAIQKQIVAARKLVETKLGRDNDTIQFIDENSYQTGMTIRDNLLFGKISYSKRHLIGKVNEQLNTILEELGLSSLIAQRGLRYKCGNAGARLPQGFRQKLALGRALIKNPDVLVVDDALSTIDSLSQGRILKNIMKLRAEKNLIWTVVDNETSSLFDQLYVIDNHSIKEVKAI